MHIRYLGRLTASLPYTRILLYLLHLGPLTLSHSKIPKVTALTSLDKLPHGGPLKRRSR